MGHKNLLVTHTLYRLKGYSEAHAVASAAPAASFKPAFRTELGFGPSQGPRQAPAKGWRRIADHSPAMWRRLSSWLIDREFELDYCPKPSGRSVNQIRPINPKSTNALRAKNERLPRRRCRASAPQHVGPQGICRELPLFSVDTAIVLELRSLTLVIDKLTGA